MASDSPRIDRQWYWDHRNRKAYYPVERDDGTVTLATVWHEEELADALETGALEELGASCEEYFTDVFAFADTFRTSERVEQLAEEAGEWDDDAEAEGRRE
jgi:hypothetical protein